VVSGTESLRCESVWGRSDLWASMRPPPTCGCGHDDGPFLLRLFVVCDLLGQRAVSRRVDGHLRREGGNGGGGG
jgi:hypothetical protein